MIELDHIAVSGVTLEEAAAHVEEALGVSMQNGGQHEVFGTHNKLLGLNEGLYLEAIATDPEAPNPARPRWFDLDRLSGPPRLSNWICRTDDLRGVLAHLTGGGTPVALTRGALSWDMAVPESGELPFNNLHPALIQWNCEDHPANMLSGSGCTMRRLVVAHPEAEALEALLGPVLTDGRVAFEVADAPKLTAEFDTPHGRRVLE